MASTGIAALLMLSEAALSPSNTQEVAKTEQHSERKEKTVFRSPMYYPPLSPARDAPRERKKTFKSPMYSPPKKLSKKASETPSKTTSVQHKAKLSPSCGLAIKNRKGPKNKRFRCMVPECGETFASKFSWRRHRKKHTGERPWGCVYCLRYFGEKSTLKKHLNTHPEFHEDKVKKPKSCMAVMNAGNKAHWGTNDEKSALPLTEMSLGGKPCEKEKCPASVKLAKQASTLTSAVTLSHAMFLTDLYSNTLTAY
eukprot:g22144.t1